MLGMICHMGIENCDARQSWHPNACKVVNETVVNSPAGWWSVNLAGSRPNKIGRCLD